MSNLVKADSGEARVPGEVWSDEVHDFWVLSDGTLMMAVRRERTDVDPWTPEQVALGHRVTAALVLVLVIGLLCDVVVIVAAWIGVMR